MTKITVVGAGLSGLAAADALTRSGSEVVVLEARDRVGGRTWSVPLGDGLVAERGAEFIESTEFAVRRWAARFQIPVISHGVLFARRTHRGRHASAAELVATETALGNALERLQAGGVSELSLQSLAREALGPGFEADPVYRRWVTSSAADPARLSAAAIGPDLSAGAHIGHEGHLLGGNQGLSIAIAASLPSPVVLNSPVTRIEQDDDGCRTVTADGTVVTSDGVVLAVPLALLPEVELELPDAVRDALSHLEVGVAAKLSVRVPEDLERANALQHPGSNWWTWRSLAADGEHCAPLLTGFAGGPEAVAALDIASGPDTWLSLLEVDGARDALLTDWQSDPWARGAYSYPTLSWRAEDLDVLQAPIGRLVLAGEHTGLEQTMNGAVLSGERAAATIRAELAAR